MRGGTRQPCSCGLPHILGAGRGADHLAAGLDIGVAEDEMAMRIVLVLALVVKGRKPRDPSVPDLVHEAGDRFMALLLRHLDRQRDDQRVGDPRIRRHALLVGFALEERPGAVPVRRHVLRQRLRTGLLAHDVIDVLVAHALLVGRLADRLVTEMGEGPDAHAKPFRRRVDGSKSAGRKIGDVRAPEGMSEGSACVD